MNIEGIKEAKESVLKILAALEKVETGDLDQRQANEKLKAQRKEIKTLGENINIAISDISERIISGK